MKNLDLISKRIAVSAIAVCAILLSAGVFIFATGNVAQTHAAEPKFMAPVAAGQIMMMPYLDKDGFQNILVWNTETGKSVSWYVNTSKNVCTKNAYQLPMNPAE